MADLKVDSVNSYDDDIQINDASELLFDDNSSRQYVDSRRRLEDKLEQRFLEKDVREFDFDL